nr:RluA family pseudouridine synthase [uncultured Catonella sp.]
MMQDVKILYEDEEVIVCIKPAGFLSQGDKAGNKDLVRELKKYIVLKAVKNRVRLSVEPYIAVVHRLDRNVRGIMVYAKTKRAAAGLSKQISENKILKKYLAVVSFDSKKINPEPGVFKNRTDYLISDKVKNISIAVEKERESAEKAELNYKIIKISGNKALVEIELITGRHHQIRLQMSKVFNGIAGDTKYNPDYRQVEGWCELALEAVELSFTHPVSKERMCFAIPAEGKEFGEI